MKHFSSKDVQSIDSSMLYPTYEHLVLILIAFCEYSGDYVQEFFQIHDILRLLPRKY